MDAHLLLTGYPHPVSVQRRPTCAQQAREPAVLAQHYQGAGSDVLADQTRPLERANSAVGTGSRPDSYPASHLPAISAFPIIILADSQIPLRFPSFTK